jgi:predicted transport protein
LARLRQLVDVGAILAMRLFDCLDGNKNLTPAEMTQVLATLESYVFRRSVCDLQTRGYWQVLAGLAYAVESLKPFESTMAGFERLPETYAFPSDGAFRDALESRDMYHKRVSWLLLERLENHGSFETSDVSQLTIEHVMPQNDRLAPEWQGMLGDDWGRVHAEWLHRLGNLTLTAYNSRYSDKAFDEKKTMEHGFKSSSLRLNSDIRDLPAWTEDAMRQRGAKLAERALAIWPKPTVPAKWIAAAKVRELQARAQKRDASKVSMSATAAALFGALRPHILDLAPEIVELGEAKSVSYHTHTFFLEVLPRASRLMLLFALEVGSLNDPHRVAEDARTWSFFFHAQYRGGVCAQVGQPSDIDKVLPLIRQAWLSSRLEEGAA